MSDTTELDLSYSTVVGLHAEVAALKAERDRLVIIADALQRERDRVRKALEILFGEVGV